MMTDMNFAPLTFAPPTEQAIPLELVPADQHRDWLVQQGAAVQAMAATLDWRAKLGQELICFDPDGQVAQVAIGYGDATARARKRFGALACFDRLPAGDYVLSPHEDGENFALAWLLSSYRFDRYAKGTAPKARLIAPKGVDAPRLEAIAAGEAITRTLINTPANDMGPAELEAFVTNLAQTHGADLTVTHDLEIDFPMIHAVGRAADPTRAPRLLDMTWGQDGPRLTLVGKGVCFDTGGLNIKPGASMGLMKKDMGGAAHVLGLAHMIMATGLPVQLRVLIPAVENAISGNAFRPGDILQSRKGLSVEINNTDAEGRLVLADALTLADEGAPDLILCMATLTGAARVAVGPDIAPFFTDDPALAQAVERGGEQALDPVWRLPFHPAYEGMIEPGIADLDNAPSGGFAGAITAALFLRRFVGDRAFMHFDCYGWQPTPAPARPKGGVGQGTRALFAALPQMLDL